MPLTLAQIDQPQLATAALFYLFAAVAGGSAIGVVAARDVVRMAVALLFTLLGVSGLYFLLNAEFLAAVQLVVYAGGTLILIVFGVMLTSKGPCGSFDPKRGEVVLAVAVGAVLLAALVVAILNWTRAHPSPAAADDANGTTAYPMATLGQALLGDYLVPFELASVLLLAAMIGAAYLAKGRRGNDEA